ncbi:MAG: hypothetical protein QOJ39_3115, partial [Candidatus Eremiobacteraeota bacterium]|nr:hypothetical protein [Candidatus Eremiobacteraeota bacterium]
ASTSSSASGVGNAATRVQSAAEAVGTESYFESDTR